MCVCVRVCVCFVRVQTEHLKRTVTELLVDGAELGDKVSVCKLWGS